MDAQWQDIVPMMTQLEKDIWFYFLIMQRQANMTGKFELVKVPIKLKFGFVT